MISDDQKSVSVQIWNRSASLRLRGSCVLTSDSYKFKAGHSISLDRKVINVVPGDYDRDGHLDLLVMYEETEGGGWWGGKDSMTGMKVYLGGGKGGAFRE